MWFIESSRGACRRLHTELLKPLYTVSCNRNVGLVIFLGLFEI